MKLINPKVEIIDKINGSEILKRIEKVARTCYKSEEYISEDDSSAKKLITNLVKSNHHAMLEFVDITVKFTCSRSIANEIVRCRLASYAQESTRYCNYSKDKFDHDITYVIPTNLDLPEGKYTNWDNDWCDVAELKILHPEADNLNDAANCFLQSIKNSEYYYFKLLDNGCKPQEAREVLPHALKTELNMKCNLREWRHFFELRCSGAAHPDIKFLALALLEQFHKEIPIIFDDLYEKFKN